MFCNFYLSVPQKNAEKLDKVLPTMLDMGILCNVYRTQSVILHKESGTYFIEDGVRVTCFDISEAGMVVLWLELRIEMDIHCIWIDTPSYNGCICDWTIYKNTCTENGKRPLQCSEYDVGKSCEFAG